MILFRYFAKEIYVTLLAVTGVLLLIFIGNQVIHFLQIAAEGKIATDLLIHIITLQIPYFIGLLLPMGVFFGVLFALSRMYVDNEMVALFAAGLDKTRLYSMIMTVVAVIAVAAGVLTLWVNPIVAVKRDYYTSGHGSHSIFDMVFPGRFQSALNDSVVFYVESMANDQARVKNFFMAERPQKNATDSELGNGWAVISAQDAQQEVLPDGNRYVVASNGYRYQGIPGEKDYFLVKFKRYGVKIPQLAPALTTADVQAKSTFSLFLTSRYIHGDMAELQWRFSIPIATLLLGLLAIPLSRVNPRQGRYAQFIPAVLICLIYVNMLFVTRAWVGRGTLSPWIGMWSVHVILLLAILIGIWYDWRGS